MIKEKLVKLVYCPTELMSADALTKALFQEKWDIFKKVLLLEDTRIDQSGSVEDGPVAAINVTAHLVSFEIPAQSGEEDEAWGKPEASKRQARGAGSIPLLWQWSSTSGNKARSFTQLPTFPTLSFVYKLLTTFDLFQ